MLFYILRRVLYAIPIALGVSIVCFSLVYIGPGDPLSTLLPAEASQEIVDRMMAEAEEIITGRLAGMVEAGETVR